MKNIIKKIFFGTGIVLYILAFLGLTYDLFEVITTKRSHDPYKHQIPEEPIGGYVSVDVYNPKSTTTSDGKSADTDKTFDNKVATKKIEIPVEKIVTKTVTVDNPELIKQIKDLTTERDNWKLSFDRKVVNEKELDQVILGMQNQLVSLKTENQAYKTEMENLKNQLSLKSVPIPSPDISFSFMKELKEKNFSVFHIMCIYDRDASQKLSVISVTKPCEQLDR